MWQEQNHPVLRSLVWLSDGAARTRTTGSSPAATVWNSGARLMQPGRIVVDRKAYDKTAADWISSAINRAVEERGRCSIGLAGGSTPEPVYRCLARDPFRKTVRWDALWVYFGDERAVPPDDAESNYRLAMDALLRHVPVPERQIFRMPAERADREIAAAEYSRLLPEQLDVLMLGAGSDGHTASLFPGSPALDEAVRRVVAVIGPKPPAARLTITPPVISSAREVLVLVTGQEKSAIVARALQGPYAPRNLPVQLAREGTWLLDRGAAAGLA